MEVFFIDICMIFTREFWFLIVFSFLYTWHCNHDIKFYIWHCTIGCLKSWNYVLFSYWERRKGTGRGKEGARERFLKYIADISQLCEIFERQALGLNEKERHNPFFVFFFFFYIIIYYLLHFGFLTLIC